MKAADLLILDDDELGLRALTRALQSRYAIRAARSTKEALAAVEARCPEVILCDYDLGKETSERFLRALTASHPSVWRVLYSGSGDGLAGLLEAKLVDCGLNKPVATASLVEAIEARPRSNDAAPSGS